MRLLILLTLTGCASLKTPDQLYTERTHFHTERDQCIRLIQDARDLGLDLSQEIFERCSK